MIFDATTLAFGRAIAFKGVGLAQRSLQEKGMSAVGTYRLKRYVLLPAIIWCLIFVRPADLQYIANHENLLFFMALIPIIHELNEFFYAQIANITSSFSALTILNNVFSLPLLLFIGTFFNKDIPSLISIISIALIVLALAIQPTLHKSNMRTRFSKPLSIVVVLVFTHTLFEAINFGLTRNVLKQLEPQVYIGVYTLTTTLILIGWTSFLPKNKKDQRIIQQNRLQAGSNSGLWFMGEIAQVFSQVVLPIYTLVSIGSVTFGMDVASDLKNRRIKLSLKTVLFILLFVTGLGLAVYSTQ